MKQIKFWLRGQPSVLRSSLEWSTNSEIAWFHGITSSRRRVQSHTACRSSPTDLQQDRRTARRRMCAYVGFLVHACSRAALCRAWWWAQRPLRNPLRVWPAILGTCSWCAVWWAISSPNASTFLLRSCVSSPVLLGTYVPVPLGKARYSIRLHLSQTSFRPAQNKMSFALSNLFNEPCILFTNNYSLDFGHWTASCPAPSNLKTKNQPLVQKEP